MMYELWWVTLVEFDLSEIELETVASGRSDPLRSEFNMHYLLIYEVVDDYVAKRAPFRDQHLALAGDAAKDGELLLGGALAEPADGAVLLFRSLAAAEAFANNDPYVHNGLVTKWTVRQWNTVAGSLLNLAPVVTT